MIDQKNLKEYKTKLEKMGKFELSVLLCHDSTPHFLYFSELSWTIDRPSSAHSLLTKILDPVPRYNVQIWIYLYIHHNASK